MKYFVISDIHSFYDAMINSLEKAGFEPNNKDHHLLVLGDLFDRGPNAVGVLEYLFDLYNNGQCTIILGNHDVFLLELLEGKYESTFFNVRYNGHGKTLEQLSGLKPTYANLEEVHKEIDMRFPYLKTFLENMPLYLELGDYIFVHGGIDGGKLDWKSMSTRKELTWGREFNLPRVEGKTVVCGHTRVATLRTESKDFDLAFLLDPSLFDILYLEGKIMIDRYVEVTKELNVLILDIDDI